MGERCDDFTQPEYAVRVLPNLRATIKPCFQCRAIPATLAARAMDRLEAVCKGLMPMLLLSLLLVGSAAHAERVVGEIEPVKPPPIVLTTIGQCGPEDQVIYPEGIVRTIALAGDDGIHGLLIIGPGIWQLIQAGSGDVLCLVDAGTYLKAIE
jgi:hypothetical protein